MGITAPSEIAIRAEDRPAAHTPPLLVPGLALVGLGILIAAGGFALVYRATRPVAPVAGPVPATA